MPLTLSSRTERFRQGKALRHKTPREAHADLKGSLSIGAQSGPRIGIQEGPYLFTL
jgi:hypothetical protein